MRILSNRMATFDVVLNSAFIFNSQGIAHTTKLQRHEAD